MYRLLFVVTFQLNVSYKRLLEKEQDRKHRIYYGIYIEMVYEKSILTKFTKYTTFCERNMSVGCFL